MAQKQGQIGRPAQSTQAKQRPEIYRRDTGFTDPLNGVMSEPNNSLHKEFELERMILFSDAVFAIAITLLIIEIKFPELPEGYREQLSLWKMFKPTVVHFMGFLLSFFFI